MSERQKRNFIFYLQCIPKLVLSVTTLAYSDIFSKFNLLLIQFVDEFLCLFPQIFSLIFKLSIKFFAKNSYY